MTKVDLPAPRIGPASRFAPKPVRFVLNWGRRYSLWVFNFGLACCAIEFISTSMSRHDFIRLGVIPFAPGPRQADLMVVSGTVSDKMAPAVKRLYEQMPEPKYVISFGACSNCGGPYWDSYCVTKGVDQIIPVDVYVPGCPPRPEALIHGIVRLQEKIKAEALGERYRDGEAVAPSPEWRPSVRSLRRPLRVPPPDPVELAAAELPTTLLPVQPAAPDKTAEMPAASDKTEEMAAASDKTEEMSAATDEIPVTSGPAASDKTTELPAVADDETAVRPNVGDQDATTEFPAASDETAVIPQVGDQEKPTVETPVVTAAAKAPADRDATTEIPAVGEPQEEPPAEPEAPTQMLPTLAEPVPEPPRERKRRFRKPRALKRLEPPEDDAPTDPNIIPGLGNDD